MGAYKFIFGIADNEKVTCATSLKTLVNILSRLLLLPFRVQWIDKSKQIIKKSSRFVPDQTYELKQVHKFWKLTQAILYLGAVISTIFSIYEFKAFFHKHSKTLAFVLSLVSDFCQFGVLTLVWKLFWWRQDSFEALINTLGHYENDQKSNWKFKISMGPTLLTTLALIVGFASPHQRESITVMCTAITNAATNLLECLFANYALHENCRDFLYALVYIWAFWAQKAFSSSEYFLIVVAYTAYLVGGEFVVAIRSTKSIDEIMIILRELRQLNDQLNSSFGNVYFLLFLCTISYYAATPAFLTDVDLIPVYWYKLFYLTVHSLIWIGTSEFHRMVQIEVRRWISESKLTPGLSPVEIGKLNLLAVENENDPVGISCRYFTVNYQLLGSLIGLLITYSIIAIQVQSA